MLPSFLVGDLTGSTVNFPLPVVTHCCCPLIPTTNIPSPGEVVAWQAGPEGMVMPSASETGSGAGPAASVLKSSPSCHVTLGNLLNLSLSHFLVCKVGLMMYLPRSGLIRIN